jgi:hypothetical protein
MMYKTKEELDRELDDEMLRAIARFGRPTLYALLATAALITLGATWWKCIVAALVILACLAAGTGRQAIERVSLLLIAYALAVWLDFAPAPAQISATITKVIAWASNGGLVL